MKIKDCEAVAKVHGENFREIRSIDSGMQDVEFLNPDWLVKIEVDAIIDSD